MRKNNANEMEEGTNTHTNSQICDMSREQKVGVSRETESRRRGRSGTLGEQQQQAHHLL